MLITGCAQESRPTSKGDTPTWVPNSELDAFIRNTMAKFRVPGVGIAVVENNKFVWQGSYGVSNIETRAPVDDKTLFQAASLSKPLFTYVVLRMIDSGVLDFNDRLADTYRPHDLGDSAWNDEITIRHVLTHQTGLTNWSASDNEAALLQAAFHWLQQVCETKTGLGLNELTDKYLFAPAGLSDMSVLWLSNRKHREVYGHIVGKDGEAKLGDLQFAHEHGPRLDEVAKRWRRPMSSWQHQNVAAANAEIRPHTHPRLASYPLWRLNRPRASMLSTAASLRTTPADYARFLALIMSNTGPAALSKSLKRDMLRINTDVSDAGPNQPVGLSWALEAVEGGVAFDHWGFNAGQHISSALGDTAKSKGLVIMTNGAQGNKFMDEVGPAIIGFSYRSYT